MDQSESRPAIEAENLTREFGTLRAVDGLSFEVPRGIVFGFPGPNGSGKPTTINLLLGLLAPTVGRAKVLGFDIVSQADEVRTRAGALLDQPGLYEQAQRRDKSRILCPCLANVRNRSKGPSSGIALPHRALGTS